LKFFFAGGAVLNWVSLLLDYSIAYGAVGLAGLAKGSKWELMTGAVIGCLERFGVHFVSGITVYAQYMPETFMDMTMLNTFHYSLLYNGTYMLPNTVIAVAACALLAKPMKRFLQK